MVPAGSATSWRSSDPARSDPEGDDEEQDDESSSSYWMHFGAEAAGWGP